MNNFFKELAQATNLMILDLPLTLGAIGVLFAIQIINALIGYRLNILGIWPRKKWGWIGIPFSPLLHGNFVHFFSNAFPLFIFSNFVLLSGKMILLKVTLFVVLVGGCFVWLFGRRGIHVGASTLIMGYLGYIVVRIYYQPTALSLLIGLVTVVYFGGMFLNLFPTGEKRVSWEGHMLGFATGILSGYFIY